MWLIFDLEISSFRDVPTVTLLVGTDKAAFHVHQGLLFNASAVFKATFSGAFKESADRSMLLPEDDVESVERMIQWLYTKNFQLIKPTSSDTQQECFMQLATLNTLADKYNIVALKNQIVDELFTFTEKKSFSRCPQQAVVTYVYNNTSGGSYFRKILVAWYTWRIDFIWYVEGDSTKVLQSIPDFAVDLSNSLALRIARPGKTNPFLSSSSAFHETPAEDKEKKDSKQEPQAYNNSRGLPALSSSPSPWGVPLVLRLEREGANIS